MYGGFMKYFTLICFLFLALIANAQTIVDEISYVPSASGYYNNLIVKGNANIHILPFPDTFPDTCRANSFT